MTPSTLPLDRTIAAESVEQIGDLIRQAQSQGIPIYPLGGGTSLHYGMPAREPGWGLDLTPCDTVVDYPARDLTVTVQTGVRWRKLQELLQQSQQELPLDVPDADEATVGGVVATAWTGPRRLGYGSVRDYVIGIEAVDGQGRQFHGGGRVVKNVAGYDFCKLLTGSMGTLGVITQVTLRVRPLAESSRWLAVDLADWNACRELTSRLRAAPLGAVTMGVICGPAWCDSPLRESASPNHLPLRYVMSVEGLNEEVSRAIDAAGQQSGGIGQWHELAASRRAADCLSSVAGFSATTACPLVIRAKMVAGGAIPFAAAAGELVPNCSLWCDTATGTVDVRFHEIPGGGLADLLVKRLIPLAHRFHGHVRVLWSESAAELTRQVVWSELGLPLELMWQVKQAFDPANVLNRDRFVW